jgi:hypothetical protein
MGTNQPDSPLSPKVIAVITASADESFKEMMKDPERGITITRDTALAYVFSSFPRFQRRHTIALLAEHYGLHVPEEELRKLLESMKTAGDVQGWVNAKLAEREGVQEKVPVQTKNPKVVIA